MIKWNYRGKWNIKKPAAYMKYVVQLLYFPNNL